MDVVLRLDRVCGGYSLRRPYLQELSFTVERGQMVGLLGLNGAGKSTTIKHILGLLQPQAGRIEVEGRTLTEAPQSYRAAIAYIPESPLLYDELTVSEHLQVTAMAYGLEHSQYEERISRLLERFQMADKTSLLPGQLSKGMRQKVMLMCAFLADTPLYLVDEPFLGLDPLGIRSLLDWMDQLKKNGASLLVSSHILPSISLYCDKFVVLHRGRVLAAGTQPELAERANCPESASLDDIFYALVTEAPNA